MKSYEILAIWLPLFYWYSYNQMFFAVLGIGIFAVAAYNDAPAGMKSTMMACWMIFVVFLVLLSCFKRITGMQQ
jgi:ABC-type transport system involved in multi-copper enzyme maturation permease subunit